MWQEVRKNSDGLRYLTRNSFFEPSQAGSDWVNNCLNDIANAFKWNKPAVISSHRVNYIGSLFPENRENGLDRTGGAQQVTDRRLGRRHAQLS